MHLSQLQEWLVSPSVWILVVIGIVSGLLLQVWENRSLASRDVSVSYKDDDSDAFLKYQPYEPPATWSSDWKVLQAMWFAKITGTDLQERLDNFYRNQADLYDSYRFRMLHGRPKMLRGVARQVEPPEHKTAIVWVDLACGTGANVENFAASVRDGSIGKIFLVDLCQPLCEVARRERGGKYGEDTVTVIQGDATDPNLPGLPEFGTVDLVTISCSLVMIPDWKACLALAKRLLRPGGVIGVADFTLTPNQSAVSRKFWKDTFAKDHVYLNPEHLPTLRQDFLELESAYDFGTLPYTPFFLKAGYYHFVGKKK